MRQIVVHMQTTLNNRIANTEGGFWEPFPWGDEEQTWLNGVWRRFDTWVLSRVLYEAIVPWWDVVASGQTPDDLGEITPATREFAELQHAMKKVVFSSSLASTADRLIVSGDLVAYLRELKSGDGGDILVSCGPATLGPLADAAGLIDEYLVVVHPAVLAAGPGMFDQLTVDIALELSESKAFSAGAVILRYRVRPA